jgi:hypothetical protein
LKRLSILCVLFLLVGCDAKSEISALSTMADKEKVWVFAQFNVREDKDGMESYYYYGSVPKRLYQAIKYNKIHRGFILLEKVKYWGDNDLIHEYKDRENPGELVFRIEDLVRIRIVNQEPIAGKGSEQFEERAEKKRNEQVATQEEKSTGAEKNAGK